MGCCCPKEEEDENDPSLEKKNTTEANKSPNSKRQKKQQEVNIFKPGDRTVRIVQNEDGKLEKTTYKPPSDPSAVENRGEAFSLVTASLMNAQKNDIGSRTSKPIQGGPTSY